MKTSEWCATIDSILLPSLCSIASADPIWVTRPSVCPSLCPFLPPSSLPRSFIRWLRSRHKRFVSFPLARRRSSFSSDSNPIEFDAGLTTVGPISPVGISADDAPSEPFFTFFFDLVQKSKYVLILISIRIFDSSFVMMRHNVITKLRIVTLFL